MNMVKTVSEPGGITAFEAACERD